MSITSVVRKKVHLSVLVGVLLAVCYGLFVALVPTSIIAFEVPDPTELRAGILADLCEKVALDRCVTDTSAEEGETGDTGEVGEDIETGDEEDTGSTGGTSGGGGSITPSKDEVAFMLRTLGDETVTDAFTLPRRSASPVAITPTDGGDVVEVDAQSALALLVAFDEASDDFTITDLQYYPAYESFFLNCIDVKGEGEYCGEWQYAVNETYPSVGMDQYILEAEDRVYVFFGAPRIVEVPTEVLAGESFEVVAQEYDPENGTYKPVRGYTVGVVQDDPDNPWTPREVAVERVNTQGVAVFTLNELGDYKVGIQEDSYYPATSFSVVEELRTASASSGGGLLGMATAVGASDVFDLPGALAYLQDKQERDGSFGAPVFTDWVTLALTAGDAEDTVIEDVRAYLEEDDTEYTNVTDHERRAMALMALGVSPYDGTDINHIKEIVSYFGGVQIGDPALVNDDIFALIVLEGAGYTGTDVIIERVVEFLVHEQKVDGSWDNDIDLTASAVQALSPFIELEDVGKALAKARIYLRMQQQDDGGFGNSFTTSWVLQAIVAFGETAEEWNKDGNTPLTYLATQQARDGAVGDTTLDETTRLWATSYAVPAVLGRTWTELFEHFEKPTSSPVVTTKGSLSRRVGDEVATTTATAQPNPGETAPVHTGVAYEVPGGAVADVNNAVPARPGDLKIEVEKRDPMEGATSTEETVEKLALAVDATRDAGTENTVFFLRFLALLFVTLLAGFGVFKLWKV